MIRDWSFRNLILILMGFMFAACSNAIPNVQSLGSSEKPPLVFPKDKNNFFQLSSSSKKSLSSGGYRGTLRISQPLGQLQSQSSEGYKLKGTVTLQR